MTQEERTDLIRRQYNELQEILPNYLFIMLELFFLREQAGDSMRKELEALAMGLAETDLDSYTRAMAVIVALPLPLELNISCQAGTEETMSHTLPRLAALSAAFAAKLTKLCGSNDLYYFEVQPAATADELHERIAAANALLDMIWFGHDIGHYETKTAERLAADVQKRREQLAAGPLY